MLFAQRIMGNSRSNKIAGYQTCTLMYQLIKSVLRVGARCAPYNRRGIIVYALFVPVNIFTVTFHICLLKISREPVHILVVRKNSVCFGAKELHVPDTK